MWEVWDRHIETSQRFDRIGVIKHDFNRRKSESSAWEAKAQGAGNFAILQEWRTARVLPGSNIVPETYSMEKGDLRQRDGEDKMS